MIHYINIDKNKIWFSGIAFIFDFQSNIFIKMYLSAKYLHLSDIRILWMENDDNISFVKHQIKVPCTPFLANIIY